MAPERRPGRLIAPVAATLGALAFAGAAAAAPTQTAAGASAGIVAYRGVDGANPVSASNGRDTRNTRTVQAPPVDTLVASSLVAASFGRSGTSGITAPAGTTAR